MTAILRKRRLRTGNGGFTADTASLADVWLVVVDEQVDQFVVLELLAAAVGFPKPKVTFKTLGSNVVVCDAVEVEVADKQRYIWRARVRWKEIAQSDSKDQTNPTPTSASADPVDWAPVVTRRPVSVNEPAERLFYEGGYAGQAHTKYTADATAGNRSPLTNSALTPFRDNLPPHHRKQSLFTIRWLRATVPAALMTAELKLNSASFTIDHRGFTQTWAAKTALVESVQLTQTQWGNQQLWDITVEILHDADGHVLTTLDEGMMEGYWPGESLNGTSVLVFTNNLIKAGGKTITEPVLLDGTGKRLGSAAAEIYGRWRDFETVAFATVPLIQDLA